MILTNRPFTVFDVDLVGAAGLLMLGLAGYFVIAVPAIDQRAECELIAAQILDTRTGIERAESARLRMKSELGKYRESLEGRLDQAPASDSLSPYLARLAAVADESDIQIIQLQPSPMQKTPDGTYADIKISARGGFIEFARFLDRLRRLNGYQRILEFSVSRGGDSGGEACALGWTVRLSMLSEPITLAPAAKSAVRDER